MLDDINTQYFDIQNKFSKGEISFDEYSIGITKWSNQFSKILKAQQDNNAIDGSRGGKLVKKEGFDKRGKKTTKWVRREDLSKNDSESSLDDSSQISGESKYNINQWEEGASKASENALNNAIKYAKSEDIRRIARNELFKRSFNPKKFIDMSLFPEDMVQDYVNRYDNKNITKSENLSISKYRDLSYKSINDKLRNNQKELDSNESKIVKDIENAINKSELKNDVVLHRGISGKNATMFVNYLKSRKVGDVFEEKSFSSTSLIQGQAIKFKELYKSQNNLVIKIYASKGQKALSMHNVGSEDDKIMYSDEFEFLLPTNSKFQIIDMGGDEISVKLL